MDKQTNNEKERAEARLRGRKLRKRNEWREEGRMKVKKWLKKKRRERKGGGGMARKGGVKTEMAGGRRDKRMLRVDGSGKNGGTTEGRHGGKRKEGRREEDWKEEMEGGTRSSGWSRGGVREARASPLNFRPNWGPKGQKKNVFGDRAPPLSQGLDDPHPNTHIWGLDTPLAREGKRGRKKWREGEEERTSRRKKEIKREVGKREERKEENGKKKEKRDKRKRNKQRDEVERKDQTDGGRGGKQKKKGINRALLTNYWEHYRRSIAHDRRRGDDAENHIFYWTGSLWFEGYLRRKKQLPYYRKLPLHEIKVFEINANLVENDFQIKEINAKERSTFQNEGINSTLTEEIHLLSQQRQSWTYNLKWKLFRGTFTRRTKRIKRRSLANLRGFLTVLLLRADLHADKILLFLRCQVCQKCVQNNGNQRQEN